MTIYRYDMSIPVRVVSALHSGGVDEVPERPITDEDGRTVQPNAFVRNGLGEAILPGRSIKGAIRAAFEEHMKELDFSEEDLKSLWGGEMRQDVGTGKESLPLRASALTFHHAVVWDRNQGDLPHRMSTAINRATGGAADGALFAYEYLPVDTTFEIRVSAEAQDPAPDSTKNEDAQSTTQREETKGTPPATPTLVEKALQAIVTLLDGKFISLGGRTGSGWGAIDLRWKKVSCEKVAILSEQAGNNASTDFLSAVFSQSKPLKLKPDSRLTGKRSSTSIEIEWQAPSGLFVGMNKPKEIESSKEDTIPAAPLRNWHLDDKHRADHGDAIYPKVAHEDKASLLLPGTSIRGALRSHCSRIARSIVSDSESSDELTMPGDVHKQLAADPLLVRYLFGTTEYRGAVRVHDCEGQIPEDTGKDKPLKLTRNAIDRVTGSAAYGALYSELLYPHATWDSIQIDVDHAQFCRNIRQDPGGFVLPPPSSSDKDYELPGFKIRLQAAILLLTLTVADLCEGLLPLGGGSGGGLGSIEVSRVSFSGLPGGKKGITERFVIPRTRSDTNTVRKARARYAEAILGHVVSALGISVASQANRLNVEQQVLCVIRDASYQPQQLGRTQSFHGQDRIHPTRVTIGWGSPTGVFVHDPQTYDGNIQHPLRAKTASRNGKGSTDPLLLPGTSIRGALRSRCSRIARTVLYAESAPPEENVFVATDETRDPLPVDIHEQLARDPNLVRYMFGTTEYRGAITVRDCTTKTLGKETEIQHNAIDRWTGGVVKGALFSEIIYPHASWSDIVIEIDTQQLQRNVQSDASNTILEENEVRAYARASWCLLCLALSELSAGVLPLGGKTTRGLGQVEVHSIDFSYTDRIIINTPRDTHLWKRGKSHGGNDRGAARALLEYLREEPGEDNKYTNWAQWLRTPDERNDEVPKSNEGEGK